MKRILTFIAITMLLCTTAFATATVTSDGTLVLDGEYTLSWNNSYYYGYETRGQNIVWQHSGHYDHATDDGYRSCSATQYQPITVYNQYQSTRTSSYGVRCSTYYFSHNDISQTYTKLSPETVACNNGTVRQVIVDTYDYIPQALSLGDASASRPYFVYGSSYIIGTCTAFYGGELNNFYPSQRKPFTLNWYYPATITGTTTTYIPKSENKVNTSGALVLQNNTRINDNLCGIAGSLSIINSTNNAVLSGGTLNTCSVIGSNAGTLSFTSVGALRSSNSTITNLTARAASVDMQSTNIGGATFYSVAGNVSINSGSGGGGIFNSIGGNLDITRTNISSGAYQNIRGNATITDSNIGTCNLGSVSGAANLQRVTQCVAKQSGGAGFRI